MRQNMDYTIKTENEKYEACVAAYSDAKQVIINAITAAEIEINQAEGRAEMVTALTNAVNSIRKAKVETLAKIRAISRSGL
jgi:uncharacterized ubiquitin-like protein YukD